MNRNMIDKNENSYMIYKKDVMTNLEITHVRMHVYVHMCIYTYVYKHVHILVYTNLHEYFKEV